MNMTQGRTLTMNKKDFYLKVAGIQKQLKAPKSQYNSFGKYSYRSCEDITERFKKLDSELVLIESDDIVLVGDRFYIKAIATLSDGENEISASGFAREAQTKKGMDDSQITGSASSYARKYALNGLFCIDDTKDADRNTPTPDDMSWVNAIRNGDTTIDNEQLKGDYKEYIRGLL